MDPIELANGLTLMLAPYLPVLAATGKVFAEGVVKEAGSSSFNFVKTKVWDRLKPHLDHDAHAAFAVEQLVKSPDSLDYRRTFSDILHSVLKSDPKLAAELAAIATPDTVQRVSAESGSFVQDIAQISTSKGDVTQEVIARDHSTAIGIRQQKYGE